MELLQLISELMTIARAASRWNFAFAFASVLCTLASASASCKGRRCGRDVFPAFLNKKPWELNFLSSNRGAREFPDWEWKYASHTFLKCRVWQEEETIYSPLSCPYHYYCTNSNHPSSYHAIADWFALALAAASFLFLGAVALWESRGSLFGRVFNKSNARYWLPSGPLILPLTLLPLAKGHRIDSLFPLSYIAPAWLQLLHISALGNLGSYEELFAGRVPVKNRVNALIFEVSMASGIVHASLYVDSVAMPYFTGLDAFMSSSFSGICTSCICRREPLVPGGAFWPGAWSYGSFVVASVLLLRLGFGFLQYNWKWNRFIREILNFGGLVMELMGWMVTAWEVMQLLNVRIPSGQQGVPYPFVICPLAFMLMFVLSKMIWVTIKTNNKNAI